MNENSILLAVFLAISIFTSISYFRILKIANFISEDELLPERKKAYRKNAVEQAQSALQSNKRLRDLLDQLKSLPRNGSEIRKFERSKVLRSILTVSKSKEITQGIVIISDQDSLVRSKNGKSGASKT